MPRLAAFLLLLPLASALKPASDYFDLCHKSDPDISNCIKNSIIKLQPTLKKGVPELNMVPLDPLFVPKLDMRDGAGNFKFRQTLSNLYIYGLGSSIIKNLTYDLDKEYMVIKSFTKTIDFDSDYDMAGRMMIINIKGNGRAIFNFTDVTTTAFIQNEIIRKKGKEYLLVKSLKWKIEPLGARFHFTNLFNGDKVLGEATNRLLNENWKEGFRIYRNLPEEAFGTLIKDLANKIFSLFPRDELFLA